MIESMLVISVYCIFSNSSLLTKKKLYTWNFILACYHIQFPFL
jgi:hypothetical protein